MKSFYLTKLDEVFAIDTIISIYRKIHLTDQHATQAVAYDFWQIAFVLSGAFCGCVNGREYVLEAGQCMLRAPGERHVKSPGNPFSCEIAIISFSSGSALLNFFEGEIFKLSHEERNLRDEALRMAEAAFSKIEDDLDYVGFRPKATASKSDLHFIKNTVERLLLTIYNRSVKEEEAAISRNEERHLALVESIREYMSEHLSSRVTLADIAKHYAISCSSLKVIFKEVTGVSVMRYFNDLIMDAVKDALRESDASLTAISERFGFSSLDYFSKSFKKSTGMSPSAYRKRNN